MERKAWLSVERSIERSTLYALRSTSPPRSSLILKVPIFRTILFLTASLASCVCAIPSHAATSPPPGALSPWVLFEPAVAAPPQFDRAKLAEMGAAIDQAIAEHHLPGAVLWLEHKGRTYQKAFGLRAVVPTPEPMTLDTIFDAASLTKVLVTTPGIMLLQERGRISLDASVGTYLPEFNANRKESISLRQLLTHTSGFRRTLSRGPDWSDFGNALRALAGQEPAGSPGTSFAYSDLNFIILGAVIERVSGMKLDEFAAAEIFGPLKMLDTGYLPRSEKISRVAPTEKVDGEVLRGKVHDPKARRMGGVAGHAGVFTTASDLARFARMMLHEGDLEGTRLFKPETVRLMTRVQTPPSLTVRRGLGWDIDSEYSRPRGELFPVGSYGHTGFTGVSLWIDPASETFWILLSNRIHPTPSGNIYALQKKLGTLAAQAVQELPMSVR